MGNHEYYCGKDKAKQFYQDAGICLLQDSCAVVGDLCIIGRDDCANRRCRATLDQLMKQAEQQHVDLQFSGHTHNGQVWPISWIVGKMYECAYGSYQKGSTQYYISSGMGIWGGKFRIGTRSEYVVATISAPSQCGR